MATPLSITLLVALFALIAGLATGAWLGSRRAQARELGLREDRARLEAEIAGVRAGDDERRRAFETAEQRLRDAFRALSSEALRENQNAFVELARTSVEQLHDRAVQDLDTRRKAVDDLVQPIVESLRKVDAQMRDVEKERAGTNAALRQQLEDMTRAHRELQGETTRLSQAMRSPIARGRWGEIQLRRVVEMAGMQAHCDFVEQVGADGGRLRPDLVVRLPGGQSVVVDAKVPLSAFLEAVDLADDGARAAKLREHARQVREHIQRLGQKSYWEQFQPAPEFVVLFLPGETFFSAAVQSDPELIEFGVDRYVIPASPTTLIALLRAAHYGWQQQRVADSAEEIRELGATLYERLRTMASHLGEVGANLERAVASYNKTAGSFESRVLVAARRLKSLGAGTSGELTELAGVEGAPRSLVRGSEDDADR